MRRVIAGTACAALVLGLAACTADQEPRAGASTPTVTPSDSPSPTPAEPSPTASASPTGSPEPEPEPTSVPDPAVAGDVATGITTPWGLVFLPDRTALVAERDTGKIKHVAAGGEVTEIGEVPGVNPSSEGGLLGLAIPPTFETDRWVYAYFSGDSDNRIVRMRYEGTSLGAPEVILDGIPMAGTHNGGRMRFGPDGNLWVGTGDGSNGDNSQDRNSLGGKILRITPEGEPAEGNPFPGSPVYSLGHRNVQGLAFDPAGRLWAAEFGQNTWDEVNLIQPGRNYGWPEVEGQAGNPDFVDPIAQWPTSDASPSGLAYADGGLWMAGLRGQRLWRIQIREGAMVGEPRAFFTEEYGRLRTVEAAPDGTLWLTTSNTDGRGDPRDGDDRILRVTLG